jgi:hypothetical protein
VVLYPQQALTQPQAAAFCKAQLGQGASLVSGHPLVLAAAQGLVQRANVSPTAALRIWRQRLVQPAEATLINGNGACHRAAHRAAWRQRRQLERRRLDRHHQAGRRHQHHQQHLAGR